MSTHRPAVVAGLVLALVGVAAPVAAAPPSNDGWASPTVIDALPASVAVDPTEATLDGDPQYCGAGTASVWYRYTAPSDVLLTVNLSSEPWMGAIHVAVDDPLSFHSCLFAGWSGQVALTAGQDAYFQVSTDGGPTAFDVTGITLIGNDRFEGAEPVPDLPATIAPDLTRATAVGDPSSCTSAPGAWYRLSPGADMAVDITPGSDAVVAVVGASAFDVLQCLYPWNGRQRVALAGGSTYHLLVQSSNPSDAGTPVTIEAVPPPPANDERTAAEVIAALPAEVQADLRSATPDDASSECFQSDWPSVWYRHTVTADRIISVTPTGGSGQAAALLRYEGTEGDTLVCSLWEDATALVRAGTTVDIALGAPPAADPSVGMSITSSPAPTLDVTILATGTVERVGGVAVISGRATCSVAGQAGIHVEARQRVGRTTLVTGEGHASFACGPTASPFTVRVPGDGAPFGVGAVAITFDASTGEWPISADDSGTATVKLRGQ